ncbi:MAG: cytochrome P450, partial [Alphaproteobacteria bacterium]
LARHLCKAAEDGGEVEFVSEIAEPLILETTRRLLGWQAVPVEQLHRWSDVLARQIMRFDQKENEKMIARTAFAEFRDYLHEERERRMGAGNRREMAGDLFDALLAVEASGEIADADEFVGQCLLLLVNGMETAPTFYASLVHRLIEDDEECARLRADPTRIAGFVEECLRLDGSVPMMARTVMQDFTLAGVTLRRGEVVLGLLAIANRDPAVFTDPDRFDAGRHPNPHLSFGRGPHRCLGSALSRLHASALVGAFLDLARLPEIPMAGWQPHQKAAIMGPAKLILHF